MAPHTVHLGADPADMPVNGLTYFPAEQFAESPRDGNGLFSFYDRVKSLTTAATTAMQTVLPIASESQPPSPRSSPDLVPVSTISASPSLSQAIIDGPRRSQTPLISSNLRYINNHWVPSSSGRESPAFVPSSQRAPPSTGHLTYVDDERVLADKGPDLSSTDSTTTYSPAKQLSRTPSLVTMHSYNPRSHLPGYALEQDDNSDTESIMSSHPDNGGSQRDYIISQLSKRIEPLRAGGLGRDFWMKDENAAECFSCGRPFTTWRRKHHCRICGQIFCSSCTTLIPGKSFNYRGKMRSCTSCLDVLDKFGTPVSSVPSTPLPSILDQLVPDSPLSTAQSMPTIEVTFNEPTRPAPMMAIPATRKGEQLEISPSEGGIAGSPRSNSRLSTGRGRSRASTLDAAHRLNPLLTGSPDKESIMDSLPSTFPESPSSNDMFDDEYNGSEDEEDEQTMRLFSVLNSSRSDGDLSNSEVSRRASFRRPRSGTGGRTLRGESIGPEQGKQSLMRIGQRRKSFLNTATGSYFGRTQATASTQSKLLHGDDSVVPAPSIDLNKASISHARLFFIQLLQYFELPPKWQDVLMHPLLLCAENIDLDIRGGDSIDIRHYVKVKRIPGGSYKDSAYLDGTVFSKGPALKSMATKIINPRILLISFSIEYSRTDQHFMSLDPVLAQEMEYTKKLVRRISALKPTVLIASNRISGLAIELLAREGVTVIPNTKSSTLGRIARYTRADILTSIDKLAVNPRLGECSLFEVKSFRFGEVARTFVFIEGAPKELGCTILLRGADMETLGHVKSIVEFMVYVVFNLRLETALMRDQFVLIPSGDGAQAKAVVPFSEPLPRDDQDKGYFEEVMKSHVGRIVSSSPFVSYGIPHLLHEVRKYENKLSEAEERFTELQNNLDESETAQATIAGLGLDIENVDALPGGVNSARQMVMAIGQEKIETLRDILASEKRQWDMYYSQSPFMFNPSSHQNLSVLFTVVCSATRTPCVGPENLRIDYYSESDMTLGQYVEFLCSSADTLCSDGCGFPIREHFRTYVNGSGRVNVMVEKFQCKLPGLQDTILMWSYCKKCNSTMPVLPMSPFTWKYSLGKYLELSFWSSKLSLRAGMCTHDIYKDHIRYFGLHDLAVRFEYDTVDLLEVLPPRPKVHWNVSHIVKYKVDSYNSIVRRAHQFWDSVLNRLNRVAIDSLAIDKIEECRERTEELKKQAEEERKTALALLDEIYLATDVTDILSLNRVVRTMQEFVVNWDAEFADFESNFFPSEKDITRITAQQLKKIFLADESTEQNTGTDVNNTPLLEKDDPMKDVHIPLPTVGEAKEESTEEVTESSKDLIGKIPESSSAGDASTALIKDAEGLTSNGVAGSEPEEPVNVGDKSGKKADLESLLHVLAPVPTKPSAINLSSNDSTGEQDQIIEEARADDKATSKASTTPAASPPPESETFRRPMLKGKGSSIPTIKADRPLPLSTVGEKSNKSRLRDEPSVAGSGQVTKKKFSERISFPTQSFRQRFGGHDLQFLSGRQAFGSSKVSSLAKHFDQLSREFEIERARERRMLTDKRFKAFPVAKSKPIVEVFKNVEEAVEELSEEEDDDNDNSHKSMADSTELDDPTRPKRPRIERFNTNGDAKSVQSLEPASGSSAPAPREATPSGSQMGESVSSLDVKENNDADSYREKEGPAEQAGEQAAEKQSLMQTLASFWADRSATGWNPLAYPMTHSEHVFADSDIIVREDEPSSLIAFCLSSPDYLERINSKESCPPSGQQHGHSRVNFEGSEKSELEKWMLKKTGVHLKYQFQEGSARLSCKIFFAEQFDAFRKQCGCDQFYIQSLSRCVKWDSSGGKSGSAFLKTLDDRLVVKQLSQTELDAFVKFAPSYFEYMAEAFFHELPTVLAKIFGFYQIQIRNTITGKTIKIDLIVMENLFYQRKMSRIFDLKGSMRNRHVKQTGRENEVLLDENMVEYIYESPLFVRDHAKRLLRTSLFNDTLFLAKMNVMDYSLVIGIDEVNKELVVGIIDFIRTFTWDKKLESWVKERGIVRGGVKEPTVVSPRQYKNRFREAMERYILMVPDCWYQDA